MKKVFRVFLLPIITLFMFSCSYNTMVDFPAPEGDISFSAHVMPIVTDSKCTGCHGTNSFTGLDLKNNTYENIMNGRVDLENPENSKIYYEPLPDGTHSAKYSNTDAETILLWIQQGAKNN